MIATDELVKRVRCLLNEAEEDARLSLLNEDTRSINAHVLKLLPQAVALVQKNKAQGLGCVNPKSVDAETGNLIDCGNGMAKLVLPNDFVALVSLRLKGWKRSCCYLLAEDSFEAMVLNNGYVGSGVHRPVCVEGVADDGARVVFLSPLPKGETAQLEHFVYEAAFDVESGLAGNNMLLADAVAYYCAALLYSVFERHDQANAFLSLATLLCNGKSVERR